MKEKHLGTLAVHGGEKEPESMNQPKVAPICASSVWSFASLDDIDDVYEKKQEGFVYSRMANPTVRQLEEAVAGLEGAADCVAFASGMAAVGMALLAILQPGDHVVAHRALYGGSYVLLQNELAKWGVSTTFVDCTVLEEVKRAITEATKLIYTETICNPLMEVMDIPALADLAHGNKALLYVDNTFGTPVLCRPLAYGADGVLHSGTKYLNGHSDVTAGMVAGDKDLIARIRSVGVNYGPVLSPFDAWLTLRGIRTLELRMERHSANAMKLAIFLEGHENVERVNYPGLSSFASHPAASKVLTGGYGGMLSFTIKGGLAAADRFVKGLRMTQLVPSLAGVSTTISHPGKTSQRAIPPEEREKMGIGDGMIRVSVGIEYSEDILADFQQALALV